MCLPEPEKIRFDRHTGTQAHNNIFLLLYHFSAENATVFMLFREKF